MRVAVAKSSKFIDEYRTLCSIECINQPQNCRSCIIKNIHWASKSCSLCLADILICAATKCSDDCWTPSYKDAYKCEHCMEKVGCSLARCFGANYVPVQ